VAGRIERAIGERALVQRRQPERVPHRRVEQQLTFAGLSQLPTRSLKLGVEGGDGGVGLVQLLLQEPGCSAGSARKRRHRPNQGHLPLLDQALLVEGTPVDPNSALRLPGAVERGVEQDRPLCEPLGRAEIGRDSRTAHRIEHRLVAGFLDKRQPGPKRACVLGQQRINVLDLVGLPPGLGLERIQLDQLVLLESLRLGQVCPARDKHLLQFRHPPREGQPLLFNLGTSVVQFGGCLLQIGDPHPKASPPRRGPATPLRATSRNGLLSFTAGWVSLVRKS
jgi:hypothetical protein